MEELTAADLHKLDTDQETYLSDILSFVVTWIENHILKVDERSAEG